MSDLIQLRRDTAADWTANDPVLHSGEIGVELDTGQIKVGDGATAWTVLDYIGATGGGGGVSWPDPPTVVDHVSAHMNASSSTVLTVPAGTQDGDLLIVWGGGPNAPTDVAGGNPTPGGWSKLGTSSGGIGAVNSLFFAIATATSPAQNVTVTFGGSNAQDCYLIVVRGWSYLVGFGLGASKANSLVQPSDVVPGAGRPGLLVLGFGLVRVGAQTVTSNLPTVVEVRTGDSGTSSGCWSGSPAQLLRHVTTNPAAASQMCSAGVAISG